MPVQNALEGALHSFDNPAASAEALASLIASVMREKLAAKGSCSVAFSGGSTPTLMFQALAKAELEWDKVSVTLVDERCVAPDNERSNARLLDQNLLQLLPSKPRFEPFFLEGEDADVRSRRLAPLLPFDILHLGMGDDAHPASFFPDAPNIATMLDRGGALPILETRSAASREERLTWSLPVVLQAACVVVQINGAGKKAVLDEAWSKMDSSDRGSDEREQLRLDMPIVAVLEHFLEDGGKQGSGPSPFSIYFAQG